MPVSYNLVESDMWFCWIIVKKYHMVLCYNEINEILLFLGQGPQLPEKSPLKVHKDVMMKPALPPRKHFSAFYIFSVKWSNPKFRLGRLLNFHVLACLINILKFRLSFWSLELIFFFFIKDTNMKWPLPSALAGDSFSDLPKDSDVYLAKRKEAYRKYEM